MWWLQQCFSPSCDVACMVVSMADTESMCRQDFKTVMAAIGSNNEVWLGRQAQHAVLNLSTWRHCISRRMGSSSDLAGVLLQRWGIFEVELELSRP
jgi:hypothetical protein